MVSLKLAALFTVAAVVAFASSAVVRPKYVATREKVWEQDKNPKSAPEYTDDFKDIDINNPIYTPFLTDSEDENYKIPIFAPDFADSEYEYYKNLRSTLDFTNGEDEDYKNWRSFLDFIDSEDEDYKNQLSTPDLTDGEDEDINKPTYPQILTDSEYEDYNNLISTIDDHSDYEYDDDGMVVEKLSTLSPETHRLLSETTLAVRKKFMAMWVSMFGDNGDAVVATGGRHKRWAPNAPRLLSADMALFKGAARDPEGPGLQQYTRPGHFQNANQRSIIMGKPFSKNGIRGRTGRVGKRRLTVRDGSKQGSPTLEIRSPKSNVEHVRKFRNQKLGKMLSVGWKEGRKVYAPLPQSIP